jgi:hypothetical protein
MPFLNIDNNWSNLAQFYNQSFVNRPSVPSKAEQFQPFDDGFIRGGFSNAALASVKDLVRIGKFITGLSNISRVTDIKDTTLQSASKGVLFLTKQLGLQQTNPRLEWQRNPDTLAPFLGGATRQFTGFGMLESIGGNAFGLHFDRAGLLGNIRDNQKYGGDLDSTSKGVVWENNFGTGLTSNLNITKKSHNRLVRYLAKIAPPLVVNNPNPASALNPGFVGPIQPLEVLDDEGNTPNLSKILDRYSGGSNSVYGLGITTIKTFKDSRTIIDLADIGVPGIPGKKFTGSGYWTEVPNPNYVAPRTTEFIIGSNSKVKEKGKTTVSNSGRGRITIETPATVTDYIEVEKEADIPAVPGSSTNPFLTKKLNGFRPFANAEMHAFTTAEIGTGTTPYEVLETTLKNSPRYWDKKDAPKNIEKRIGTSTRKNVDAINVIDITDSYTFYDTNGARKSDKPNTTVDDLSAYNDAIDGNYGRDMIRLAIEFLNNDAPIQGSGDKATLNTDVLAFRAYIDDFNDGMNAKWNSYRYMGRGEDFYIYDGFTRDISLAFTIYAHGPKEMKPLYRKLNYLMSTFAPDYSKALKMRGNIAYLTVGDYLSRQPGIFTDIKLTGILDTHWENNLDLKLGNEPDIKQNVLPKHIKVSLSFKPIHNLLPRKSTKENPFLSNFILPSSTSNRSPVDIIPNRYT